MDTVKERLLEGVRGTVPPFRYFPEAIHLGPKWPVFFDELYNSGGAKPGQPPKETARVLKTNAERTKVLIEVTCQEGSAEHIRPSLGNVRYPEVLLGTVHKHPVEMPLSSEDILPLLLRDGPLIEGVATPGKIYLAFRSQETPALGSRAPGVGTSVEIARGYVLAMAEKHGIKSVVHPETGKLGVPMTSAMLRELKIPLYEGPRGKSVLALANP